MFTTNNDYTYNATGSSLTKLNQGGATINSDTSINDGPYIGYKFRPAFDFDNNGTGINSCARIGFMPENQSHINYTVSYLIVGANTLRYKKSSAAADPYRYLGGYNKDDTIEVIIQDGNLVVIREGVRMYTEPIAAENFKMAVELQFTNTQIYDVEWITAASAPVTASNGDPIAMCFDGSRYSQDTIGAITKSQSGNYHATSKKNITATEGSGFSYRIAGYTSGSSYKEKIGFICGGAEGAHSGVSESELVGFHLEFYLADGGATRLPSRYYAKLKIQTVPGYQWTHIAPAFDWGDVVTLKFNSVLDVEMYKNTDATPFHTQTPTKSITPNLHVWLQSYYYSQEVTDMQWILAAGFDSTAISNAGLKTSMDTASALQDDTQRRLAYQTALTDATVAKFTGGRVGVKTTVLSVLASIDAGDTLVLSRFLGVTNRQTVVVRPEETGTPVVVAIEKAVYIPGVGRWTRENDRVRTLTHDSAADTYSLQINAETPLVFEDQAAGTTVTYVDDGKEWNLTLGSGHETRIGGGFFRVSSATHGLTIVNDAFVRVK